MDSSLIFLVIIGLWAAYLVPQWLRRREQLSAARSVSRFTAAMRVLSRRGDPVRSPRPAGRGYVLGTAPRGDAPRPALGAADDALPSCRTARVSRPSAVRGRPHTGAVVLCLLVAALGICLSLAAPAWVPWLPGAALALTATLLRRAAVRRRAERRPTRSVDNTATPAQASAPAAPAAGQAPVVAHGPPAAAAAAALEPGSWTPVPVPIPTYLLKSQAPPRRVVELPHPDPAPAGEAARTYIDLDAVLSMRRAAGQ